MSPVLMHASQPVIMPDVVRKGKKKVRKIPELLGRDALELMIDDFRLMIAAGPAEIFVLFVGFVVEEPGSRYSVLLNRLQTTGYHPGEAGYAHTLQGPRRVHVCKGDCHPANVDGKVEKKGRRLEAGGCRRDGLL